MPSENVSYHWAFSPTILINPSTFTEYHCDINLPEKHTLRRILLNQPLFFWKRGSEDIANQEMYFVHYDVQYGEAEGSPYLYRTIRSMRHQLTFVSDSVVEPFYSQHWGAELELGMNERVQRGGFYSFPQRLRLTFFIGSSGESSEVLSGQANMPFRALYSLPILP
jgi:hypothetical protein